MTEPLEDRRMLATWVPVGPSPIINNGTENVSPNNEDAGAIHTVVAHPTDPDTLYIGSVNGGIWKTENATDLRPDWTPLTDHLPSLSIADLSMDPDDPDRLVGSIGRSSAFGQDGGDLTGLLLTTDGGATWSELNDPLLVDQNITSALVQGDVILATSQGGIDEYVTEFNQIISAPDSDPFVGISSGGLFRSDDGGQSWTSLELLPRDATQPDTPVAFNAFHLAADPSDPNLFFAAIQDQGIYRSNDQGLTWTDVSSADATLSLAFRTVELRDAMGGVVLAASNFDNNNTEMAIAENGRAFVAVMENGQVEYIGYSDDQGDTWIEMDQPYTPDREPSGRFSGLQPRLKTGGQGAIHFSITVDPTNPDIVYVGGDRQGGNPGSSTGNSIGATRFTGSLFRGDVTQPRSGFDPHDYDPNFDAGPVLATSPQWAHLTHSDTVRSTPEGGTANRSAPHADSRDMTFDANGELIEVDDGGIYRRTSPRDNTGDWFSLNGDLQIAEMHSIAYDSNSGIIVAGNQDVGSVQQTATGSSTWEPVDFLVQGGNFPGPLRSGGDGGDIIVDDTSDPGSSYRYVSSQNLGLFRRLKYDANNNIVEQTDYTLGDSVAPFFVNPLAINAVDPQRFAMTTLFGVFEQTEFSDNVIDGNDWVPIFFTDDFNFALPAFYDGQNALAYGGSRFGIDNDDLIYAAINDDVVIREETGDRIDFVRAAFPGDTIQDFEPDSNDWRTLFVADDKSVYVTKDAGARWSNITGNLTSFDTSRIRSMEFIPGFERSAILVGTNRGIYVTTTDNLGEWTRYGDDLPNAPVFDMEYDPTDDVLVAGTLGRGAWMIDDASGDITDRVRLRSLPANTVHGVVISDVDASGYQNNGERGLGGVVVYADANGNQVRDPFEAFTTTEADGSYMMTLPGPTTYTIAVEEPSGFDRVGATENQFIDIRLPRLSAVSGVNFALAGDPDTGGPGPGDPGGPGGPGDPIPDPTLPGIVEGRVYFDANANGVRDDDEGPVNDVWAFIDLNDSCVIASTEPAVRLSADGSFRITNVPAGTHELRITPSSSFTHDVCASVTVTVGDGTNSIPTLIRGIEFGVTDGTNGGVDLIDFGEDETASHGILPLFFLGDVVLPDPDSGEDNDGVTFVTGIQPGATETLAVEAMQGQSARGYFNGWIDFNGDGTFSDAEQIFRNRRLDTGENTLTYEVPAGAPMVNDVLARFRWGFERDQGPTGFAIAGEVEDYRVDVPQDPDTGTEAVNDEFTVSENTTDNVFDVLSNDVRLDDTITLDIGSVSEPANGMVTIRQGTGDQPDVLLYTPNPDFFGEDTFTYVVTDSLGGSDDAVVTITVDEVVAPNVAPIANDDLDFDVDEATPNNFLDVLANDSDPNGDPIQITEVSMTSSGGTVTITETGLLYTPALGFTGIETFTYTIADPDGLTDEATVMVVVNDVSELVRYRLEATDPNGNVISEIFVDQDFLLNVYVQDLRADAQGVFSAYLDVTYDSTLASVAGDFTFGADYPDGQSGTTTTAGLIDEAGATDGISPLGPDEKLLWSLPFTGDAPGTLFLAGNPADELPIHETSVFGNNDAVDAMLLDFLDTSIIVNAVTAGVNDDMFSIEQDSLENPLTVLDNDFPPVGGAPFTLISVTDPANGMAMVEGDQVLYTPDPGYIGPDSFMYTVRDANDVESTANVSINVTQAAGIVGYDLIITNGNGEPIESVNVGETFQLMVFTDDLRDEPMGVFAGYLDVLYSGTGAAEVSAPIEYGEIYPEGREGTLMPGLIDELGAFDGITPFGDIGQVLLANVTFMATAAGVLDFMGDPADILPNHHTLIFGEDGAVDLENIRFGSDSLTINAATLAGSPFTNPMDAYDADEDGILSPRDALVIINDLATNGARSLLGQTLPNAITMPPPSAMVDVNSDMFVSAQDALWVVNEMAVREAVPSSAPLSTGGSFGSGLQIDLADDGILIAPVVPGGSAIGVGDVTQPSAASGQVGSASAPLVQASGSPEYGHLVDAAFGDGEEDEADWDSTLMYLALDLESEMSLQ